MTARSDHPAGISDRAVTRMRRTIPAIAVAPPRANSWWLVPVDIVVKLFVLSVLLSMFSGPASSQEGMHGHDHDKWHADFYSKLMRPDTKTSCCNLADCRPTEVRTADDHYEVKKDGRWIRVQADKIVRAAAPDGGAHICAPPSEATSWDPDYVFCIVLPTET